MKHYSEIKTILCSSMLIELEMTQITFINLSTWRFVLGKQHDKRGSMLLMTHNISTNQSQITQHFYLLKITQNNQIYYKIKNIYNFEIYNSHDQIQLKPTQSDPKRERCPLDTLRIHHFPYTNTPTHHIVGKKSRLCPHTGGPCLSVCGNDHREAGNNRL